MDTKKYLVIHITVYWPVHELTEYIALSGSAADLVKYGSPSFENQPVHVKRKYVRKSATDKKLTA